MVPALVFDLGISVAELFARSLRLDGG